MDDDTADGKCSNIGCMDPGKMICSRCKWAGYCSKVCQKAHWKRHKGFCIAATPSESLTVVMVEGKEFWTAEILESSLEALLQLRLSMIVKSKSKLTDHRSQCACASCHGDDRRSDLMLRVLGLLVLRTGAAPSEALVQAIKAPCVAAIESNAVHVPPYKAGFYPIHQAVSPQWQLAVRPHLDGAGYRLLPLPHHLNGDPRILFNCDFSDDGHRPAGLLPYEDQEVTIVDLLIQRLGDVKAGRRARWPTAPELGLGGDGHGIVDMLEEAFRRHAVRMAD